MSEEFPLGYIEPADRTPEQNEAHAAAIASMPAFAIEQAAPTGPVKVILTDFLDTPDVLADFGEVFTGFRQLTGSCVGVSEGNAICTLSAIQRNISDSPTKAFIPWWPFPYGRTRWNEGDRGQGEGAVVSIMARTLKEGGVFGINEIPDEPPFDKSDGFTLTKKQEFAYSDGNYSGNTKYLELGKQHPLGTAAPLYSIQEVKAAIINGYPVNNGCSHYPAGGSMSGGVALGRYDSRGGHATNFIGYWDHPQHGPLYLYWNQWGGQTYPEDGSGKPRCSVWMKESEAARLFKLGGSNGETLAFSHLNYFPAQPRVLDWFIAP